MLLDDYHEGLLFGIAKLSNVLCIVLFTEIVGQCLWLIFSWDKGIKEYYFPSTITALN